MPAMGLHQVTRATGWGDAGSLRPQHSLEHQVSLT